MHVWPFYAGLAVAACVASWRNVELRPVGVAVVVSLAASNAAHWWLPAMERPAAYTVAEATVLSMAFLAHVCGASRLLVAIVAVSIVSIGLNIRMTTIDAPTLEQIRGWEVSTNVCFAAECLLVITSALHERVRRTFCRFVDGRRGSAFHGRAARSKETNR